MRVILLLRRPFIKKNNTPGNNYFHDALKLVDE